MRLVQELFPRIIVMDEGRSVADGLTMEILENDELLTTHGLEKPYETRLHSLIAWLGYCILFSKMVNSLYQNLMDIIGL